VLSRLVARAPPPQHRFQLDPGLGERVVRNQARIGQRVEQLALVDFAHQLERLLPFAIELVDFVRRRFVLRPRAKRRDLHANLLRALAVLATLVAKLFEMLQQTNAKAITVTRSLHVFGDPYADARIEIAGEQCSETFEERRLISQRVIEERIRGSVPGPRGRSGKVGKEQLEPGSDGALLVAITRGVENLSDIGAGLENVLDRRVAQEFDHREPILGDHRAFVERIAENLPRVLAKRRRVRGTAECRRRADANRVVRGCRKPRRQAPQHNARSVPCAPVARVQLVDDDVAQRLRRVVCP
jgi:hypothetical protein